MDKHFSTCKTKVKRKEDNYKQPEQPADINDDMTIATSQGGTLEKDKEGATCSKSKPSSMGYSDTTKTENKKPADSIKPKKQKYKADPDSSDSSDTDSSTDSSDSDSTGYKKHTKKVYKNKHGGTTIIRKQVNVGGTYTKIKGVNNMVVNINDSSKKSQPKPNIPQTSESIFDQQNDIQQGNNLARGDVWCVFNHITDEYLTDEKNKFYFETVIHFNDPETDTAILELKPNVLGTPVPLPFTKFSMPDPTKPFYLIGHPAGGKKKSCLSDNIINIGDPTTYNHIITVRSYCAVRNLICEVPGYNCLDNPARWLFDVADKFTKGASGCPGLVFNPPHDVRVVTVLLRGYPDFFYDEHATSQQKDELPLGYRVEQGANMHCVFANLQKQNPSFYDIINC